MSYLPPSPVATCTAYRSGFQTISTGSWTAAVLNGEDEDTEGWHSTTVNPSRITVDRDGLYLVVWTATFATNGTGDRMGRLYINGGDGGLNSATVYTVATSFATSLGHSTVVRLEAGDYVEMAVYQSSGGNLNLPGGTTYNSSTVLSVTLLGS